MALNLQSLTAFVDEQRLPLIKRSVLTAKTAKMLNLQTGVKGTSALNLLETTVVFGDGTTCGWDEAGVSKLSQRKLEVGQIKINKEFCDKDMLKYWMGYDVKVAAGQKTLPFEEDFVGDVIDRVSETLEKAIWTGDKDSLNENLNKFDGLIKIIDATIDPSTSLGAIQAVNTGIDNSTGITASNVITVVDNVFKAIPAELLDKEGVVIVAGADTFRKYVVALRSANLFHYSYDMNAGMELTIPGTMIKLMAVNGLNGTDRLFAFHKDNVFFGTDLEGDNEKFEFWYSQDKRVFMLAIEFAAGVQVAFPNQIVSFKKA